MMENISMLAVTFGATVALTMLIMLLPAILELKKPLDAGPRLIMNDATQFAAVQSRIPLKNLEDESKPVNQLKVKLTDFHSLLPNLEA